MKKQITLSLDEDLLARLEILARYQQIPVDALIAEWISEKQREYYEVAQAEAFASMSKGFDFGGQSMTQEEIYDRESLRRQQDPI